MSRSAGRTIGVAAALAVLAGDQASKSALIGLLAERGPRVELLPGFDLVMVWNRGISFGLLPADGELTRWALTVVTGLIALGLAVWLARAERPVVGLALGLVVGGAVGNIVDRVRFGAVADFFDFHIGNWHWPAFNIADAGITIGIIILLCDTVLGGRATNPPSSRKQADQGTE